MKHSVTGAKRQLKHALVLLIELQILSCHILGEGPEEREGGLEEKLDEQVGGE